jgi:hypothetical protein
MLSKIALEEDWRKIRKVNHYVRSFRGITGHIGANATFVVELGSNKKRSQNSTAEKGLALRIPVLV